MPPAPKKVKKDEEVKEKKNVYTPLETETEEDILERKEQERQRNTLENIQPANLGLDEEDANMQAIYQIGKDIGGVSDDAEWEFDYGAKDFTQEELDEAEDKNVTGQTLLDTTTDVNEEIEANQTAREMLSHAVFGGIYKGGNTILENFGYLSDIITPEFLSFSDNMDEGYTNFLSEWAAKNKGDYDKANPIYGDSGLAQVMQGLQGLVDSTVGFAATGAGVGSLIGKGAQILNQMVKAGYMTEAMIARVGTAVATNYAESEMQGAELHKNVMQSALRNGISAEDAVIEADARKKQFIWEAKMNIVSDVFALRSMSKGSNIITGAMNKTRKQKILGGVVDAVGEGVEEITMGSLQKRGERQADINMKVILDDDTSFIGRGIDYAVSKEGLKEGLMGMFGGPFQSATVGGTSKLIKKVTERVTGRPTAVNDPGEFTEKAPVFEMEAPRPIGKKPLTTAEKYLKFNSASASMEEAESYTTDEERAADEAAMEDWLNSGSRRKSAQDYVEGEKKYKKELELYNQRKEAFDLEKKNYEDYTYETKLGSRAQAKQDVEEFLNNDASLRRKYNKSFIDGDVSKAEDIEKDRFEGLFIRYADRGMTDGLSDQLTEIMEDPESTPEMKKYATTYKEKIKGYQKDYMAEYNKHGRRKGKELFKLKKRIESTKEAITSLNKEMDLGSMKLAGELLNSNGKIASPMQTEILGLQAEQRQLEQMKRKLSAQDNSVLKVEFDKKEKDLEKRIKKLTSDLGEEVVSKKDIQGLDAYKEFESKAKQRADAWLAHQGYKKSYEWQSSPKMEIAIKKQNFNHLMKEIEENTFNDNDVAINLALSRQLDLSDKQKAAFHQAIDLVSKDLKTKREIDVKDYKKLLRNKKDYDRVAKSIEQSTLDAIDEIKVRKRNDYSIQDQNIEKARRAYLDDQAKAHQMQYESIFERDRVSLKAHHQKNADRNFNLYKKAQWEKVAFIRQNEDKLQAAYNRVKENEIKKIRVDALRSKTKARLETNQAYIDASAFAFNEKSFMAKMERKLQEEETNAENINLNRTEEFGEEPEIGPEGPAFVGASPSSVVKTLDQQKKDGIKSNHNSKWSKTSTTDLLSTIKQVKAERNIEGSEAETNRTALLAELEKELDSRKNGKGKDGYAEYGAGTDEVGNIKGMINGSLENSERGPEPGPDDWRDWNQGTGTQGFDEAPEQIGEEPGVTAPYSEFPESDFEEQPPFNEQPPMGPEFDPGEIAENNSFAQEFNETGQDPQFDPGPDPGPVMEFEQQGGQPDAEFGEAPEPGPVMEFTPGNHSEPGNDAPDNNGQITPAELQAGAQVVKDLGADEDNKELETALSHLATVTKEQNPTKNEDIAPNDFDKPENKSPVSEQFNEKTKQLNEDWPWSISYVSYSDGIGDKNQSGLTDWLETSGYDKRTVANGHTIRYEFEAADANLKLDGVREIVEKYKKGEELTDADISNLPIRMVVYTKEGNPLIQDGNKVYGWMKTATYFTNNSEMEAVLKARKNIIEAFIEGSTYETKIEKVSPGILQSEDEYGNSEDKRKNPRNYLPENQKKLVVSDGISLVDQDRKDDGDLNHPHTNRGFVFLKTKDANGRFFPLKLNSRRLERQEVEAIVQILKNYGLHGQDANSDATIGTVSGLKNKDIMDLLIFTGSKSKTTAYPFNVDNSKGTLEYGETTIQLKDLQDAGEVIKLSKYLSSMWRTTNIPMMNRNMNKSFSKDFTWFGKEIKVSSTLYNDFLFADEALSTNASFYNDRLFIQPAVITSRPEQWKKVSGKRGVKSEDNSKAIQRKKDEADLTALIVPLEKLLVPIKLSWDPSQGYKVIDANSNPQKVMYKSREVKDVLRFAKNEIIKNNQILEKQRRQAFQKSKESTPTTIKGPSSTTTEGIKGYDKVLNLLKADGVNVKDSQKVAIKKALDNNGGILYQNGSFSVQGKDGIIQEYLPNISEAVTALVTYNSPAVLSNNAAPINPNSNLSINKKIEDLDIEKQDEIEGLPPFLAPEDEAQIIAEIENKYAQLKKEAYYQDSLNEEAARENEAEALVRDMVKGKVITDFTPEEQTLINTVPIETKKKIQNEEDSNFYSGPLSQQQPNTTATITEAQGIKQEALDSIKFNEDKLNNNKDTIRGLYDKLSSLPQNSKERNNVLDKIDTLEKQKLSKSEEQRFKSAIEAAKSRVKKAEAIISGKTTTTKPTTDTTTADVVNIYAGTNENAELSNFAERPFTADNLDGETYNTVEGAFQATKLEHTNAYSESELEELRQKFQKATGSQAKALGRKIKGLNTKSWNAVASEVMKDNIYFSFQQNPNALQKLLATGNATLTHTQDRGKWSTEFPRILMEVREELKPTTDKTTKPTANKGQKRLTVTKQGVAQDLKVDLATGIVYKGTNFRKKVVDPDMINLAHLKSGYVKFTPVNLNLNGKLLSFAVVFDKSLPGGMKVINTTDGQYRGAIATNNQTASVKRQITPPPTAVKTTVPDVVKSNTFETEEESGPPPVDTSTSQSLEGFKEINPEVGPEGVDAGAGVLSSLLPSTNKDNLNKDQKTTSTEDKPKTQIFGVPAKRGSGKFKKGKTNIDNPNDNIKNKGKDGKDGIEPKYSMMESAGKRVDAKKEREILKKMLPNVPVNIIEGLIGTPTGGFAEGQFYEGVVSISNLGNRGVAYHEGFHAVVSSYLTSAERNNLFNEARKRFGKENSDHQIEEILAEEFRTYMIKKGEMKVPSTFKWLYDMLKDLINLFRGKQKSLFSKIRDGRFDYMPPYAHSKEIAYSELAGNISAAMKRETIDALTYRVVQFSGVRSMDTASRMYESIDEILEDVRDSIIDDMAASIPAAQAGNPELYNNFNTITTSIEGQKDNWPAYSQLVKDELTSLNLKFTKQDSTKAEDLILDGEEEEINEALNIKSALLFSGKDNASNNTKMMVKMIKDPKAKSAFFGPGFERLANYDTSWRIIENTLAGMSNTAASTQVEKMNDALEVLAQAHPEFNEIIGQLKETDQTIVPDYKKIQFYRAFSKQQVLFNHTQIKKVDGDFNYLIGNADSQSHATLLKKEWSETFKSRFTNEGEITSDGLMKMKKIVKRVKNYSAVIEDIRQGNYPSKSPYVELAEILQEVGIGVTEPTLKAFILTAEGKTEASKLVKMYKRRIEPMLLNTPNNRGMNFELMTMPAEYLYDDENTFVTDYNQTIGPLAVNEGFQKKDTLENMVMGPDGNLYWSKSLNSNISKTISQWKADPAELDRLLNSEYHRNSKWLAYFAGREMDGDTVEDAEGQLKKSKERLAQFEAEVFLSNRMDDGQDMGTAYNKLTDVDGTIDTLNKTLFGLNYSNLIGSTLSPLTFADKSTFYMFSGIPIETFGLDESGASDKAVNTMYQYFTAEAERLNSSNINKTGNKYFDEQGSKEFHWYPELSPGTPLSKEINLFTESIDKETGNKIYTTNLTDPKVTRLVKKHIGEAIADRIYEQKQSLINQTIIKEDENNNYTIEGVDSGILSYYRRNTTSSVGETKAQRESNQMNEMIDNMVSDYVLNAMVSNIEYTMMFSGDPAFYKDLSKRTPSGIATGIDLINLGDEPTEYTVSVINDKNSKSSLYGEYLEEFKRRGIPQAEAKLKPYLAMEKADAQAYITPKRFKSLMKQLGEWTPEHDDAYARLNKGENVDHNDLLMMQPLKGMHYELRNNQTGFLIPTYLKYSQAPLWPALVKGTKNENLLNQMIQDGVDEVVYGSGVKTGASEKSDMGPILDGTAKKGHLKTMTLSNYHWKLQQDLSAKYEAKGRTIVASQVRKNIKANISGRVIDGAFVPRMFTDQTTGERVDGDEMAKRIDGVESQLSDLGRDEFIKKYDIRDGKINNTEPIFEHLEAKFKKDQADSNLIGQLGTKGNRPSLDLMFAYKEKIEQELFSELNKATVRGEGSGGAFIQISGEGFTGLRMHRDGGSTFDINSIIPLKDINEFKGPRKGPNGNMAADVMIPFSAVRDIPNYEKLNPEVLKKLLGDTIQDLVGYRIPNQGMSSIDLFNVVGILPPSAGDSIVVYDEITGKTGSDFDIDKMYVMMHKTVWNPRTSRLERVNDKNIDLLKTKSGKPLSTSKAQKILLENQRMTLWASVLESDDSYVDIITPLDAEWLRDEGYYCDLLTSDESNKEDFLEYLKNIKDENDNPKEEYQNLNFDSFRKLPNRNELAHNFGKQKKGLSLQFASPKEQLEIKSKNVAGQSGVGMTANHLVHFVLMQQIGRSNELNEDGDKITDIISAWLNAYVDNAKDPFISLLNNNTFTADTVFFLLREGVSPKKINRLMSSPIMKEYANQHYISKSKIINTDEKPVEHYRVKSQTGGSHPYTSTTLSIKKEYGTKDPLTKTVEKFGLQINNKTPKDSSAFSGSLKSMTIDQLEDLILNPTNASQLQMLAMFENGAKSAKSLTSIVKAAKFDTKGAGLGNVEHYTKTQEINNLGINALEPSYWAESYLEIQDKTFLKAMKSNSHDLAGSIYGNLMFSGSDANRGTMSVINAMTKSRGTNLELNKLITKDHYNFLYSAGFRKDKTKLSIKELFYGKKNIAVKLLKFRELYPNNKLLKTIKTDVSENVNQPSFLLFPASKKKGRTETDELVGSWKELLDDNTVQNKETGYTTSDFAKELVQASFASSGFNKNINSFFDLISHEYMRGDITNPENSFNNQVELSKSELISSFHSGDGFINQFFRHNWLNEEIVPSFKATHPDLKNISNTLTKQSSGFIVKNGKLPNKMNLGSKKHPSPREYVTLKGVDLIPPMMSEIPWQNLYKFIGTKDGTNYYKRISPLGTKEKGGKTIKEYNIDARELESDINPGASRDFDPSTFKLSAKVPVENDGQPSEIKFVANEEQNSFEINNIPFVFDVEEVFNNSLGVVEYQVFAYKTDETGNEVEENATEKSFKSYPTELDAFIGTQRDIQKQGLADLLLSLNNEC